MSLFRKLFPPARQSVEHNTSDLRVLDGPVDLEVVGEAYYQDALWQLTGQRPGPDRVRIPIAARLIADTDNQYDANAVSIWIDGSKVGHLSRGDAERYRPGLIALEARLRGPVLLPGVIVGGGDRDDGPGRLGVFLRHDPADFGLEGRSEPDLGDEEPAPIRTGLGEAWATDDEDDDYDLAWMDRLPDDPSRRIPQLRKLLEADPDPIDRHYMFAQLAKDLYYCRDVFASALDEFDDAVGRLDAEMDAIRDALVQKFGVVPLLEAHRQMVIRQQKAHDWHAARRWASRCLELYGDIPARPEFVEDMRQRLDKYEAKLAVPVKTPRPPGKPAEPSEPVVEVLVCGSCGGLFERIRTRGRKPTTCPACSSA